MQTKVVSNLDNAYKCWFPWDDLEFIGVVMKVFHTYRFSAYSDTIRNQIYKSC